MKDLFILIFILALNGCSEPPTQLTAIEFIEKTNLGEKFPKIIKAVALKTQTFLGVASEIGKEKAIKFLDEKVIIATKEHQYEWNSLLSESYLEHFTVEELNSVYYEKGKSKYAKKMLSLRGKVGESMRIKSNEFLKKVVTNITLGVFNKSSNTPNN